MKYHDVACMLLVGCLYVACMLLVGCLYFACMLLVCCLYVACRMLVSHTPNNIARLSGVFRVR